MCQWRRKVDDSRSENEVDFQMRRRRDLVSEKKKYLIHHSRRTKKIKIKINKIKQCIC